MSISNYLEAKLMALVFNGTSFANIANIWGALHTGVPGETATANPLASTPRSLIVFNTANTSIATNATAVTWTVSATGFITDISLWDSSATATANALWSGTLNTSKAVNVGDTVTLASGALTVTLT